MSTPEVSPPSPGSRRSRPDAAYFFCLGVLTTVLGAMVVWRPLSSWLDFWAHAAVGRWIRDNGRVPDSTLFLWSASEPWVYHSWLSQLVFYGLTNVGGPDRFPVVVLCFTVVAALLPFASVALVWHRRGRLSSWMAVPFVMTLKGLALRFQTRPELFTGVLLTLLLLFLLSWSRPSLPDRVRKRDWLTAAAILLAFVLWANLHGAVVLGLLVLGVTAACELVQARFGARSRLLALVAALAPLTVLVNPYGFSYWQAFRPVASADFATSITEWAPAWKAPLLPSEMFVMLAVLLPPTVAAWAMNPQRRWSHLAWLVLVGVLFLTARRNVWPFALTSLVVLAANASSIDPVSLWRRLTGRQGHPDDVPFPARVRWAVRVGVLIWVAMECALVADQLRPWQSLVPTRLDGGAVRFLKDNPIEGRLFNDYENSGYLEWRLGGNPPLFIDLLNAYPDRVMREYAEMAGATERGRLLFEQHGIAAVVLTTNRGGSPSLSGLARALDSSPRWVRIYAGNDGVVWVRRTAEYEHLWRPRLGAVKTTEFAILERWASDESELAPASIPEKWR